MKKKMILVGAPPACGKNYVSELICNSISDISYFDKDDLAPLIRRSFALANQDVNMDGSFYVDNLRDAEYETILNLAFSALRFSNCVLVNAPFIKEARDPAYMSKIKEKANEYGAHLILVWVSASSDVCYKRMKLRNSERDTKKLENWDEYFEKTNYSVPFSLESSGAVDKVFEFNNEENESAAESLKDFLNLIGESND